MAYKRSVSQLGFVDVEERHAPIAFGRRPASLYEVQAAGNELGIDVFFEPQYMWLAEEYLTAALPPNWEQCWDNSHSAWYYVNNKTNEATWESPTLKYFKSQYEKQRKQDEAEGRSVVGMASRSKVRARKEQKKLKSKPALADRGVVRRGSISHAEDFKKSKGHLSDFRRIAEKSVIVANAGSKKANKDAEDAVYTPESFIELAKYLGVRIGGNDPTKSECHLIRHVLEFLDRVHGDELPTGWVIYHDEQGYPYYFHESTHENTYDHPLAKEIMDHIKRARNNRPADALRTSAADEWIIFGGTRCSYYNMRSGKSFPSPPHVSQDAAKVITRIIRRETNGITKKDIMNAFYSLDSDHSSSLSIKEIQPVLKNLGGMNKSELEKFVNLANPNGTKQEFTYTKFVDELWKSAKKSGKGLIGKETYNVHGHVHDLEAELEAQISEEEAWKIEGELREVKKGLDTFLAKVEQASGNPADAWTIIDYNQVMDLLSRGRETDIFNVNDPYKVKAYISAQKAQKMTETYEEAEALRQAREMLAKKNAEAGQLAKQRDEYMKKLTALTLRIKAIKVMEFTGGVVDTNLNGFLFPEVAELEKCLGTAADILINAQEKYDRLPTREQDLKPNMVKKFIQKVSDLEETVVNAEKIASDEISKRTRAESNAKLELEMNQRKKIEEERRENERKKKQEEEKRKALQQLDKERIAAEIAAGKEAERKQALLQEEREKMKAEMEAMRKAQEEAHKDLEAWAGGFNADEFATPEELEEAEIRREIELEERREKEAAEREEMEKKQAQMEAEMKAKEEALQKKLEEERKIREQEEEVKRQQEIELQRFEDAKKRDAERKRLKEKEEKRRKRLREKARAAVDADDDDTEEEIQARKEATERLKQYNGDVWDACKAGNVEMVRAFFLVHGSKKLLEGKMSRCHHKDEWGRTLLHMASWWGNIRVIEFLTVLGADVNAIDTSVSNTTPLIEAARAGKREACEVLIKHGANVRFKDAQGDTAIHWAARRGWGTLLKSLIRTSDEVAKGTSRHLLTAVNNKGHTPVQLATNETVRGLIQKELDRLGALAGERKGLLGRMKKGFAKAKFMGNNVGKHAVRMQHKRYGKMRSKKKGHKDSHHKKSGKRRKHKEKHHEEKLLDKHANAAVHDVGDGGVPDELLAMGIGLDDFHYGNREH